MKAQRVLAIDPGKKSGVALFSWHMRAPGDTPALTYSDELDQFETCKFVDDLLDDAQNNGYNTALSIVLERFKIADVDAAWSLEIIGTVRYLAALRGLDIVLQTPADAKSFVTNEKLHAIEMWHVGGAGHANDAIRHGVLYMVRKQLISARSLLVD